MGAGPMTGRARGYCAGFGGPGGGFGRGGRGWRHRYHATGLPGWMRGGWGALPPAATQKQWLEKQAEVLQSQLDEIRQRLSELELEKK